MYDLVKVINTAPSPDATDPFAPDNVLAFNVTTDDKLTLAPGESRIVRFDTVAAVFGHPLIRDNGPKDRGRVDAYATLRFYWGFHSGFDVETERERMASPNRDYVGSWEAKMPRFRIETLDGEWVPMVLDDPAGTADLPGTTSVPEISPTEQNVAILQTQLAAMQAQQERLIAMIAASQGIDPADLSPDVTGVKGAEPLGEYADGDERFLIGGGDASIPLPADRDDVTADNPTTVGVS